jgi:hypothetical protein
MPSTYHLRIRKPHLSHFKKKRKERKKEKAQ